MPILSSYTRGRAQNSVQRLTIGLGQNPPDASIANGELRAKVLKIHGSHDEMS